MFPSKVQNGIIRTAGNKLKVLSNLENRLSNNISSTPTRNFTTIDNEVLLEDDLDEIVTPKTFGSATFVDKSTNTTIEVNKGSIIGEINDVSPEIKKQILDFISDYRISRAQSPKRNLSKYLSRNQDVFSEVYHSRDSVKSPKVDMFDLVREYLVDHKELAEFPVDMISDPFLKFGYTLCNRLPNDEKILLMAQTQTIFFSQLGIETNDIPLYAILYHNKYFNDSPISSEWLGDYNQFSAFNTFIKHASRKLLARTRSKFPNIDFDYSRPTWISYLYHQISKFNKLYSKLNDDNQTNLDSSLSSQDKSDILNFDDEALVDYKNIINLVISNKSVDGLNISIKSSTRRPTHEEWAIILNDIYSNKDVAVMKNDNITALDKTMLSISQKYYPPIGNFNELGFKDLAYLHQRHASSVPFASVLLSANKVVTNKFDIKIRDYNYDTPKTALLNTTIEQDISKNHQQASAFIIKLLSDRVIDVPEALYPICMEFVRLSTINRYLFYLINRSKKTYARQLSLLDKYGVTVSPMLSQLFDVHSLTNDVIIDFMKTYDISIDDIGTLCPVPSSAEIDGLVSKIHDLANEVDDKSDSEAMEDSSSDSDIDILQSMDSEELNDIADLDLDNPETESTPSTADADAFDNAFLKLLNAQVDEDNINRLDMPSLTSEVKMLSEKNTIPLLYEGQMYDICYFTFTNLVKSSILNNMAEKNPNSAILPYSSTIMTALNIAHLSTMTLRKSTIYTDLVLFKHSLLKDRIYLIQDKLHSNILIHFLMHNINTNLVKTLINRSFYDIVNLFEAEDSVFYKHLDSIFDESVKYSEQIDSFNGRTFAKRTYKDVEILTSDINDLLQSDFIDSMVISIRRKGMAAQYESLQAPADRKHYSILLNSLFADSKNIDKRISKLPTTPEVDPIIDDTAEEINKSEEILVDSMKMQLLDMSQSLSETADSSTLSLNLIDSKIKELSEELNKKFTFPRISMVSNPSIVKRFKDNLPLIECKLRDQNYTFINHTLSRNTNFTIEDVETMPFNDVKAMRNYISNLHVDRNYFDSTDSYLMYWYKRRMELLDLHMVKLYSVIHGETSLSDTHPDYLKKDRELILTHRALFMKTMAYLMQQCYHLSDSSKSSLITTRIRILSIRNAIFTKLEDMKTLSDALLQLHKQQLYLHDPTSLAQSTDTLKSLTEWLNICSGELNVILQNLTEIVPIKSDQRSLSVSEKLAVNIDTLDSFAHMKDDISQLSQDQLNILFDKVYKPLFTLEMSLTGMDCIELSIAHRIHTLVNQLNEDGIFHNCQKPYNFHNSNSSNFTETYKNIDTLASQFINLSSQVYINASFNEIVNIQEKLPTKNLKELKLDMQNEQMLNIINVISLRETYNVKLLQNLRSNFHSHHLFSPSHKEFDIGQLDSVALEVDNLNKDITKFIEDLPQITSNNIDDELIVQLDEYKTILADRQEFLARMRTSYTSINSAANSLISLKENQRVSYNAPVGFNIANKFDINFAIDEIMFGLLKKRGINLHHPLPENVTEEVLFDHLDALSLPEMDFKTKYDLAELLYSLYNPNYLDLDPINQSKPDDLSTTSDVVNDSSDVTFFSPPNTDEPVFTPVEQLFPVPTLPTASPNVIHFFAPKNATHNIMSHMYDSFFSFKYSSKTQNNKKGLKQLYPSLHIKPSKNNKFSVANNRSFFNYFIGRAPSVHKMKRSFRRQIISDNLLKISEKGSLNNMKTLTQFLSYSSNNPIDKINNAHISNLDYVVYPQVQRFKSHVSSSNNLNHPPLRITTFEKENDSSLTDTQTTQFNNRTLVDVEAVYVPLVDNLVIGDQLIDNKKSEIDYLSSRLQISRNLAFVDHYQEYVEGTPLPSPSLQLDFIINVYSSLLYSMMPHSAAVNAVDGHYIVKDVIMDGIDVQSGFAFSNRHIPIIIPHVMPGDMVDCICILTKNSDHQVIGVGFPISFKRKSTHIPQLPSAHRHRQQSLISMPPTAIPNVIRQFTSNTLSNVSNSVSQIDPYYIAEIIHDNQKEYLDDFERTFVHEPSQYLNYKTHYTKLYRDFIVNIKSAKNTIDLFNHISINLKNDLRVQPEVLDTIQVFEMISRSVNDIISSFESNQSDNIFEKVDVIKNLLYNETHIAKIAVTCLTVLLFDKEIKHPQIWDLCGLKVSSKDNSSLIITVTGVLDKPLNQHNVDNSTISPVSDVFNHYHLGFTSLVSRNENNYLSSVPLYNLLRSDNMYDLTMLERQSLINSINLSQLLETEISEVCDSLSHFNTLFKSQVNTLSDDLKKINPDSTKITLSDLLSSYQFCIDDIGRELINELHGVSHDVARSLKEKNKLWNQHDATISLFTHASDDVVLESNKTRFSYDVSLMEEVIQLRSMCDKLKNINALKFAIYPQLYESSMMGIPYFFTYLLQDSVKNINNEMITKQINNLVNIHEISHSLQLKLNKLYLNSFTVNSHINSLIGKYNTYVALNNHSNTVDHHSLLYYKSQVPTLFTDANIKKMKQTCLEGLSKHHLISDSNLPSATNLDYEMMSFKRLFSPTYSNIVKRQAVQHNFFLLAKQDILSKNYYDLFDVIFPFFKNTIYKSIIFKFLKKSTALVRMNEIDQSSNNSDPTYITLFRQLVNNMFALNIFASITRFRGHTTVDSPSIQRIRTEYKKHIQSYPHIANRSNIVTIHVDGETKLVTTPTNKNTEMKKSGQDTLEELKSYPSLVSTKSIMTSSPLGSFEAFFHYFHLNKQAVFSKVQKDNYQKHRGKIVALLNKMNNIIANNQLSSELLKTVLPASNIASDGIYSDNKTFHKKDINMSSHQTDSLSLTSSTRRSKAQTSSTINTNTNSNTNTNTNTDAVSSSSSNPSSQAFLNLGINKILGISDLIVPKLSQHDVQNKLKQINQKSALAKLQTWCKAFFDMSSRVDLDVSHLLLATTTRNISNIPIVGPLFMKILMFNWIAYKFPLDTSNIKDRTSNRLLSFLFNESDQQTVLRHYNTNVLPTEISIIDSVKTRVHRFHNKSAFQDDPLHTYNVLGETETIAINTNLSTLPTDLSRPVSNPSHLPSSLSVEENEYDQFVQVHKSTEILDTDGNSIPVSKNLIDQHINQTSVYNTVETHGLNHGWFTRVSQSNLYDNIPLLVDVTKSLRKDLTVVHKQHEIDLHMTYHLHINNLVKTIIIDSYLNLIRPLFIQYVKKRTNDAIQPDVLNKLANNLKCDSIEIEGRLNKATSMYLFKIEKQSNKFNYKRNQIYTSTAGLFKNQHIGMIKTDSITLESELSRSNPITRVNDNVNSVIDNILSDSTNMTQLQTSLRDDFGYTARSIQTSLSDLPSDLEFSLKRPTLTSVLQEDTYQDCMNDIINNSVVVTPINADRNKTSSLHYFTNSSSSMIGELLSLPTHIAELAVNTHKSNLLVEESRIKNVLNDNEIMSKINNLRRLNLSTHKSYIRGVEPGHVHSVLGSWKYLSNPTPTTTKYHENAHQQEVNDDTNFSSYQGTKNFSQLNLKNYVGNKNNISFINAANQNRLNERIQNTVTRLVDKKDVKRIGLNISYGNDDSKKLLPAPINSQILIDLMYSQKTPQFLADNLYVYNSHPETLLESLINVETLQIDHKTTFFSNPVEASDKMASFHLEAEDQEIEEEIYIRHSALSIVGRIIAKGELNKEIVLDLVNNLKKSLSFDPFTSDLNSVMTNINQMASNTNIKSSELFQTNPELELLKDLDPNIFANRLLTEFIGVSASLPISDKLFMSEIQHIINNEIELLDGLAQNHNSIKMKTIDSWNDIDCQTYLPSFVTEGAVITPKYWMHQDDSTTVVDLLNSPDKNLYHLLNNSNLTDAIKLNSYCIVLIVDNKMDGLVSFMKSHHYKPHTSRSFIKPHSTETVHTMIFTK